MIRRFFFAVLLVVACVTVAAADSNENAVSANNRRDFALAERLFRPLAEQGHALAQFYLGVMYDKGQGVPQDAQEALKWIRLAAEQGGATQQGVPQGDQEALKWYHPAAEQGQTLAQCNLGVMYAYGQGVPQDAQKVAK